MSDSRIRFTVTAEDQATPNPAEVPSRLAVLTCEHDGHELTDGECPNLDCLEQYQYGETP